jgi:mevalonate pyrophosphate decarboxylase
MSTAVVYPNIGIEKGCGKRKTKTRERTAL